MWTMKATIIAKKEQQKTKKKKKIHNPLTRVILQCSHLHIPRESKKNAFIV